MHSKIRYVMWNARHFVVFIFAVIFSFFFFICLAYFNKNVHGWDAFAFCDGPNEFLFLFLFRSEWQKQPTGAVTNLWCVKIIQDPHVLISWWRGHILLCVQRLIPSHKQYRMNAMSIKLSRSWFIVSIFQRTQKIRKFRLTYLRWLFHMLKPIKAIATTMPQPDTVLMQTNSDNETVRKTRRTIVRSCGIWNRIDKTMFTD